MYTRLFILITLCYSVVQCADLSESQGKSAVFEPRPAVLQPSSPPAWVLHVPPKKDLTYANYGCCTFQMVNKTTHYGCCNASCEPTFSCCPKWTALCLQTMLCCPPTALVVCATSPCWVPYELHLIDEDVKAGVLREGTQQWHVCKRFDACCPPFAHNPHTRDFILDAYRLPICWPCASFYGFDDQAHCFCGEKLP